MITGRDKVREEAMIADLVSTSANAIGKAKLAGSTAILNPNDKIVLLLGLIALRLDDLIEAVNEPDHTIGN